MPECQTKSDYLTLEFWHRNRKLIANEQTALINVEIATGAPGERERIDSRIQRELAHSHLPRPTDLRHERCAIHLKS